MARSDLSLQCVCGAVKGMARGVSGENGNRLVYYCDDCQSFAYFLGGAKEILDEHGGTVSPRVLGEDELHSVEAARDAE